MLSLISPSPPLLRFTANKATLQNFIIPSTSSSTRGRRGRWVPQTVTRVSSSDETKVAIASIPTTTKKTKVNVDDDDEDVVVESAEEVVRKFYDGINGRDLASVEDLIANNCVYEDLIFATPFVGRKLVDVASSRRTITTTNGDDDEDVVQSAAYVVRNFYKGINVHNLVSVEELIAGNCVYEDPLFPYPFFGHEEILQFFKKFTDSTSIDLQFVIDDLSTEDSSAVGVTWHLDWRKRPFPFSKGCSFYRLEVVNKKRQIIYGRDSVEPAIKPGEAALVAIRGVTWLLQRFPQLADRL